MWKPGARCVTARKILFFDASRARCQAEATSEMAIEMPPDEKVKGGDLIGELLKSLYGTRKAAYTWEKKWQRVIVDSGFVIGTWSPAIVCCRERELCGFVHGDDFIITCDSMQLAWIEYRVNEGLILKRRAILGLDDGNNKTVTVLNRLMTWVCLSGSRSQIEVEADPRHREILLAQMNLDGANVKSVTPPAMKMLEWTPQMLTNIEKDRASTCRSATKRASYMSVNRVDVQHAVKEVARFMAEPNEGAWIMLKRLVRSLVGQGRLVQEQRDVKAPRVDTDSDYAGCVLTRKSTTCAHLFHGVNLIKAGSQTQGTRSLSVAESQFYGGVKGGSMLLGAKSTMIDFGENVAQCVLGTDSSSAKSITERRGAGRIRHLHCPMLWLQERVDSGEVRAEKRKGVDNTADIGTKAVTARVLRKTVENAEDGVARCTTPVGVECGTPTLVVAVG